MALINFDNDTVIDTLKTKDSRFQEEDLRAAIHVRQGAGGQGAVQRRAEPLCLGQVEDGSGLGDALAARHAELAPVHRLRARLVGFQILVCSSRNVSTGTLGPSYLHPKYIPAAVNIPTMRMATAMQRHHFLLVYTSPALRTLMS